MSTIFPGSASVGQIFDGYEFNGTAWDIIGIDLTADYLESSTASSTYLTKTSASTTYLAIDSGSTVKTMSIKENQTQAVYGTTNYNFYNQTYTTNSKVASKLLITFGVAYEFNTASDSIQLAVSLNGTDEFTFNDTGNAVIYNDMPFYTFISTNSYSPSTTISNLRVYIKALSGTVVCPRNAGTLHNFFLTVQEIAV
jgi:hypothetical protein